MATAGLQRIRQDVDTHYDEIVGGLLEGIKATRTITCKTCGSNLETWDGNARTQAAKLLLELGYGKATPTPAAPDTHTQDDLAKADDRQLEAIVSQGT